jgi:hypothetical protein
MEADDGELYVVKFVGSGQGPKALVAEIIVGEIARSLGLNVPELVLVEMDGALARSERHQEIRDLLLASVGLNLGMRFLSGAFAYNPLLQPPLDAQLSAQIVWLDAYTLNVDRTPRNVNLLLWQQQLWLIDHGAALYFHYDWGNAAQKIASPFTMVRQHVLLPFAADLADVDQTLRTCLDDSVIRYSVDAVPDIWLTPEVGLADAAVQRKAYVDFLIQRRRQSSVFVEEAVRVRAQLA